MPKMEMNLVKHNAVTSSRARRSCASCAPTNFGLDDSAIGAKKLAVLTKRMPRSATPRTKSMLTRRSPRGTGPNVAAAGTGASDVPMTGSLAGREGRASPGRVVGYGIEGEAPAELDAEARREPRPPERKAQPRSDVADVRRD